MFSSAPRYRDKKRPTVVHPSHTQKQTCAENRPVPPFLLSLTFTVILCPQRIAGSCGKWRHRLFLSTHGMHLRTAISSRLALVQRGQMSGSICWITFRPAQSAVNWDTFKTNSSPLSARMSTNTSSGLNVRFLKKLFSHLVHPWTLWSSASLQGMSLKAFPQKKEEEKKQNKNICIFCEDNLCGMHKAQYRDFSSIYLFPLLHKDWVFVLLMSSADEQRCSGTMDVFLCLLKA